MASIQREFLIEAHPDEVWSAMRDFGAVDRRLAPGFVTDSRLDGDARIVTFHNGTIAREPLVDCDDERRRLVYSLISERVRHYNASVQVFPDGELRTRVSWIVDVLPHDVAPYIASQMDLAVLAMKKALASTRAPQSAM